MASNIKNIGGWSTKRKLIVFESDDWGSNRISSKASYEKLVAQGIIRPSNHYDKFDTLEKSGDIENLLEVLSSFKDNMGNHPVFTPFFNTANPDFEKIRQSEYNVYHYKSFWETLDKYGEKDRVMQLWKAGISNHLVTPAFHGREHLCVPLWMRYLGLGHEKIRKAFEHQFYSVSIKGLPLFASAFRPALFFDDNAQIDFLKQSLTDGLNQMKFIFGETLKVFCPPNGISHPLFDEEVAKGGVLAVVTKRFRPEPNGLGAVRKKHYGFGSKNKFGQIHYFRNCGFEPVSKRGVDICLKDIAAAFRWGKPAIISTHRVNYIGSIDPKNSEYGLTEFRKLLHQILKKWPQAEFVSSNQLCDLLHNKV